jgi:hypothetical protein
LLPPTGDTGSDPNPSAPPPFKPSAAPPPAQPAWLTGMAAAGVSLPVGAALWGSQLLVHDIKLDASTSGSGAGWWAIGPSSHPSSERAAVTPLAPPMVRQHLHRRGGRYAAKAVGGGSFADRSGTPLVGEASCGAWPHLRLGDMRRTVAAPLRGGEQAFLRRLTRSPS